MKNLTSRSVLNGSTGEVMDSAQLKQDVTKLTENLPSYDTETVSPSNKVNVGVMQSRKEVLESRKVNHSQRTVIVPDPELYGIPNAGKANAPRLEYLKNGIDYTSRIPNGEEDLMRQPDISLESPMIAYAKMHGINNGHSLKSLAKELNIPPIDIDELVSSEPQGVLLGMIDDMDKEVSFVEFAKTKHIKTMDCFGKRPNKVVRGEDMDNKEWEKMFKEEFNDIFSIPNISLIRNPSIGQALRLLDGVKSKWMPKEIINVKITLEGEYSKSFEIRDALQDIVSIPNGTKLCGHNLMNIIQIDSEMEVLSMKYYTYDKLKNGEHSNVDSAKREICIVVRLGNKKVYNVYLTHWERAKL